MSAEQERICALLHIAEGKDLMLSSPIEVQRKLFAVRCVMPETGEEKAENVEDAQHIVGIFTSDNRPIPTEVADQLTTAELELANHTADLAVVGSWLEREDPALYAAASSWKRTVFPCACCSGGPVDCHKESIRAWVSSLSTPANAAKRRRVQKGLKY